MKLQRRTPLFFGCIFLALIFYSISGYAQNDVLSQRLQGKTKFKEIMQEVDDYFRLLIGNELNVPAGSNEAIKRKEYKRWKRWEWYHSARLNPDGTISNASEKLLEVLQEDPLAGKLLKGGDNTSSLTNSGDWTVVGPSSTVDGPQGQYRGLGRIDRIAFHPTNSQIYYVGTPAGGLWRTINDGASWTNLSDELPTMGISGIVVSHANPNTLYILTGDGDSNVSGFVEDYGYIRWSQGVFKSTDGGSTWQKTAAFPGVPQFYAGYKLVQNPLDANFLYAATSVGIFKTEDGGLTWSNACPSQPAAKFHDVEFKPNSSVAYAVARFGNGSFFMQNPIFDDFEVFAKVGLPGNNNSNNSVVRYAIAVSPAAPEQVVLLAGASIDSTGFQGIFVSSNSGASFTARANTPNILGDAVNGLTAGDQADYDLCTAVASNDASKIVTGGLCVWRSDNGGTSFAATTKYGETVASTIEYIHPDVHDVSYNPLNNYLYACTDGGIYKSTNHGVNWTDISAGLIISQYYHLAGTTSDVNKLLGGLQDNGTLFRTTNSASFTQIRGGDGFRAAISTASVNTVYTTANTSIYRSTNGGTTNSYILPFTSNVFFPSLRLNPSNQSKVYLGIGYFSGTQRHKFYHSDDGGFTYVDSTTINVSKDIACAPSDVNVLYGTDGFNIWRSQNEGFSFQLRVSGLPAQRAITGLTVNPNNSAIVVATLGGFTAGEKVYYTVDAGLNWQNLSGTLPNVPVTCSAINTNGDVYIGTDIGVFYQAEAESDWRPFYNGLPRVPVTELIIYPTSDLIRAATFGRGIWQTSLYTNCPTSVFYTATVTTPKVYNASVVLSTSQTIIGSSGVNVLYKSGSYISMIPGFRATANSVMNAKISPCLPGIDPSTQLKGIKGTGAIKVPPLPPEQTQKTGPKESYY